MRRVMSLLLGLVIAGVLALSLSPLAFARPLSGTGLPFVPLVHTAINANTYYNYAVIVVTQNWNSGGQGGVFNVHQVGVWYDRSHWAILNKDSAPIPVGAAFNVYIVSTTASWAFTQRETSTSYVDDIDNTSTNYQLGRLLFVTPNFDPAGNCPCAFDNHPLGVYYDYNHERSVYHQDIAPMAVSEAFNIFAFAPST